MKRPTLIASLLLAALCCGGCSHIPFFGKKRPNQAIPRKPKQSKYISTSVEREFQDRWVDKRTGELVSQGQTASAARDQALREFQQKFSATTIVQHP